MSSVVRGERVVLPDGIRAASIHIRNGRIVDVAEYSDVPAGVRRFDAGELILLPGLVDTHVHMNDPGREDWEGVGHATRAAAAGGVTTREEVDALDRLGIDAVVGMAIYTGAMALE